MSPDDLLASMVADLAKEVEAELADPNIRPDQHGRPIGYHKGCRGPLCRKQNRERQRGKNQTSANPWADAYLESRLTEHKESLKNKKEKVA